MLKYINILFILLLLVAFYINPRNVSYNVKDINFTKISREHGLSQATILCIYQDHKGLMWFGTEDGLNRYDGKSFLVYKHDFENKNSLSNNYVKCIIEDSDNNLWIGTGGGGLNLYDREKEIFISFKNNPENKNSLSNNNIFTILEDSENNIWIGTEDGLNIYDGENFFVYKHDPEDENSISDNYISYIIEDSDNNLWIATGGGGLNKYLRNKKSFKNYKHDINNINSIGSNSIWCIFEDSDNNIWIGTTRDGVDKFNKKEEIFTHYTKNPENKRSISDNIIKCIFEDSKKNLWIGTAQGGLNLFDKKEKKFIHYKQNSLLKNCISDNNVTFLYEDYSGIIWVGTYSGGVNKIDWKKSQFKKFLSIENNIDSLCDKNVWAITEDEQERIWIGTSNGLSVYDKSKKVYKHYKHNPFNNNTLTHNFIYSLLQDSKNDIWVGCLEGLNLYDKKRDSFIHNFNCDDFDIRHGRIFCIFEDSRNNIWLGTHNGLILYNREKNVFELYRHNPENPNSLSHNLVWAIGEDSSENLWFGTIYGLNKFDRNKKVFYRYYNDPNDPDSLSYNLIMCIFKDSSDNLWIGTWGGGLNKYDNLSNTFKRFSEKNGLVNNVIYGIQDDLQGNLWISTNNGISKFNSKTLEFRNYDISDGLICNEFNGRAVFKNKNNDLYFGGIEGLISFNPNELSDYQDIPGIVITDFKVLNKSIKVGEGSFLSKSIEETKNIVLSYRDNVFSFEFTALHYSAPEKNQYAYMLKGFDKDWIYSGNRSFVTYTNLNPGRYTFKVKGSNKDDIWNELGASLNIRITPPLWRTWWAYCLYVLFFIMIIIIIINYKLKKQGEIFKNKIKEIEINNLVENVKQKTNYFINLAHETKTPLTLIKNYLDKYILRVGLNEELKVVKQNIDKLTRDMVNFLDSEKLKNGQIYYDHSQVFDLSAMIMDKIPLFRSVADDKKIKIKDNIMKNIHIKADPYAVDRLVNNLIDNAIRYTNDGGYINVLLRSKEDEIELIIEDNGIGISDEQQKNLFYPFHQLSQGKRNIQGIGMGLYIVKQIVESLNAKIKIDSKSGIGSKFLVILKKYTLKPGDKVQQDLKYSKPITDFSKIKLDDEEVIMGRYNVLVVEDNIKLLKYIQDNLKTKYNVFISKNGQDALNKLSLIQKPDIIISDIMMDIMDGYKFFEAISNDDNFNDIPFIFLTVKTSLNEKIKALSSGVIDYIYKPFSIDEIIMKIQAILNNIKFQKEKDRKELIKRISSLLGNEFHNNENLYNKYEQIFFKYGISKREKDVIKEIIKGRECKEVAMALDISENTVNTHMKKIYKKCNINNRVELVNIFKF